MDASCKIQGSIHSICLVHNMCPELWVHINLAAFFVPHDIVCHGARGKIGGRTRDFVARFEMARYTVSNEKKVCRVKTLDA